MKIQLYGSEEILEVHSLRIMTEDGYLDITETIPQYKTEGNFSVRKFSNKGSGVINICPWVSNQILIK